MLSEIFLEQQFDSYLQGLRVTHCVAPPGHGVGQAGQVHPGPEGILVGSGPRLAGQLLALGKEEAALFFPANLRIFFSHSNGGRLYKYYLSHGYGRTFIQNVYFLHLYPRLRAY